jgi:virginiamycin B lyase
MKVSVRRLVLGLIAVTAFSVPAAPAGAFIYWSDAQAGHLGRSNLNGELPNYAFIGNAGFAQQVAVDGTYLYWATYVGTIARARLDGSQVDPSFITVASPAFAEGVAVDSSHIYWTNDGGSVNTIGRANLDGSGVNQNFITGASNPNFLAVDNGHIYWTNYSGQSIGRANIDGSGVNQSFIAFATRRDPFGIAVDSGHIYWSNTITSNIGRANLDGTAVNPAFITLSSGLPAGVAVDAQHIYWAVQGATGSSPNKISWAQIDGQNIQDNLVTGLQQGVGVALDAGGVARAPSVDLRTPPQGATYALNQQVAADYSCTAGAGGILQSCQGTIADGALLPTDTAGTHSVSVTATGTDGQTTTVTHTYTVSKAATSLKADALVIRVVPGLFTALGTATATLTSKADNHPVAGAVIRFSANGKPACSGTTNSVGVAQCKFPVGSVLAAALGGLKYSAIFAGDSNYTGSSDSGPAVILLNHDIL